MKKIIPILFILISTSLSAQITLNRSDLIQSGQKAVQATHDGNRVRLAAGANMTWNLSDLRGDMIDSLRFGLPFWYKGYENFPDANLAYINYGEDSIVYFMKATSSELRIQGFYEYTDSSENILQFNSKIVEFPSTYNSTFAENTTINGGSIELGFDPDSTGPLPFIDSIRFNLLRSVKSNVDGWGNLTTPLGTYSAIMQTSLQIDQQSVDMKSNGVWTTVPPALLALLKIPVPEPDSNYNVNMWTNDARVGFPLISYDYSPGDDSVSTMTWLKSSLSASSIAKNELSGMKIYPNPVSSTLNIESVGKGNTAVLFNAEGKEIYRQEILLNTRMDLSALPAGIYLLQVINSETGMPLGSRSILKQ